VVDEPAGELQPTHIDLEFSTLSLWQNVSAPNAKQIPVAPY
jgi:hypothetical protein